MYSMERYMKNMIWKHQHMKNNYILN